MEIVSKTKDSVTIKAKDFQITIREDDSIMEVCIMNKEGKKVIHTRRFFNDQQESVVYEIQ